MFVNVWISAHTIRMVCPKPIWRCSMGRWEWSNLVIILEDLTRKSSMSFEVVRFPRAGAGGNLHRRNILDCHNVEMSVRKEWSKYWYITLCNSLIFNILFSKCCISLLGVRSLRTVSTIDMSSSPLRGMQSWDTVLLTGESDSHLLP